MFWLVLKNKDKIEFFLSFIYLVIYFLGFFIEKIILLGKRLELVLEIRKGKIRV